jgi:hypothetical protein
MRDAGANLLRRPERRCRVTFDPIKTPADAILYCDFLSRFATDPNLRDQMLGISGVIRDLVRRLQEQAVHLERAEASREAR